MADLSGLKMLTGCTVGWLGPRGTQYQGEVTGIRHQNGLAVLQVRTADGQHVWLMADLVQDTARESFFIVRHGPRSIEYGLQLADQLLQGKGSVLPVNTQMTTLAATVIALHTQLEEALGVQAGAPSLTANGASE